MALAMQGRPATEGPRLLGRNLVGAVALMVICQLPLGKYLFPGDTLGAEMGREAVFWGLSVALIVYILWFERRPLSSIHLNRPTWRSALYGISGAAVMVAGIAAIYLLLFPALGLSASERGNSLIMSLPIWFRFLIVIRAAVFEELFYRGFVIERLTEITGLRWLAAAVSLCAFTFAHLQFWGWAHLIVAAFGGVVLTLLYLWRRDLVTTMLAHFVTDAVGFLLA